MKIKLERLGVPSVPKIESLAHGELIRLAIQMRERILIYEGTIFRSKEREFGKSSERGSSEAEKPESESETNNSSQGEENPPKNPPKILLKLAATLKRSPVKDTLMQPSAKKL